MVNGMATDYDSLKQHSFFAGIDFETLNSVAVPMPAETFSKYKQKCIQRLENLTSSGDSSGFYAEDNMSDEMLGGAAQNSDIVNSDMMSGFVECMLAKKGSLRAN